MIATNSGDPEALGPTAPFRELQIAQEQQANPMPFPSLPTSGMGLGGVQKACL